MKTPKQPAKNRPSLASDMTTFTTRRYVHHMSGNTFTDFPLRKGETRDTSVVDLFASPNPHKLQN